MNDLQPTGNCRKCTIRPATIWWIEEGGLDFFHGGGQPWCERCCVEEQLVHARERASKIPELEAKLKELE